ncbi:MAG TPA: hypothetical protein VNO24_29790 [Blastocatellia bacterium]|nr:hypothetical protein [Blastocatellia bacterium]
MRRTNISRVAGSFRGHGVVSDELKRDYLAGIGVKGKIVMVFKRDLSSGLECLVRVERGVFSWLILHDGLMASTFPQEAVCMAPVLASHTD